MSYNAFSKPLFSERLYSYLKEKPEPCDVTFIVGPQKEKIPAVKLILIVASDKFRKIFDETWDNAVGINDEEGQGIPLPDLDPEAFKIFLKLLPSETVSTELFREMNLSPNTLFSLIEVSTEFEIKEMVTYLEPLISEIIENFPASVKSTEFVDYSRKLLRHVLSSDRLTMNEVEIFEALYIWAEHHCELVGKKPTAENVRDAIGDCLLEIRFPLMTTEDFSKIVRPTNILTDAERLTILEFIIMDIEDRASLGCASSIAFGFKICNRNKAALDQSSVALASPSVDVNSCSEISSKLYLPPPNVFDIVRLFLDSQIVSCPSFTCDGNWIGTNFFSINHRIEIHGIGFLGPIDADAKYHIKLKLWLKKNKKVLQVDQWKLEKELEGSAQAIQHRVFYYIFNNPVVVEPYSKSNCDRKFNLGINYSLTGPATQSLLIGSDGHFDYKKKYRGVNFQYRWHQNSNQMVDLLFRKI